MKVVVFGAGDIAQLAHFYLTHDSPFEVVAFTVDRAFVTEPAFCGLPVVPFEEINARYPPDRFDMFVALSCVSQDLLYSDHLSLRSRR